jgi:hypothetical protein
MWRQMRSMNQAEKRAMLAETKAGFETEFGSAAFFDAAQNALVLYRYGGVNAAELGVKSIVVSDTAPDDAEPVGHTSQ